MCDDCTAGRGWEQLSPVRAIPQGSCQGPEGFHPSPHPAVSPQISWIALSPIPMDTQHLWHFLLTCTGACADEGTELWRNYAAFCPAFTSQLRETGLETPLRGSGWSGRGNAHAVVSGRGAQFWLTLLPAPAFPRCFIISCTPDVMH